jgi:hypothetical protein
LDVKTRKLLVLCLLLALSVVPYAVAGTVPASVQNGGITVAGKICSFQACIGTGTCLCPNGQVGHCVNGACTL